MASFWTILLIGVSLSMDAFSLALVYGLIINDRDKIKLSLIVGIFHFVMPLIGILFGNIINNFNFIDLNIISFIIFIWLGIDLIFSSVDDTKEFVISFLGFILFSLSVSIDSLTVGIGLKILTSNWIISSLIFSLCSFSFTYLGLYIGSFIENKIGYYSKIIGGITLIIIAIFTLIR